MRGGIRGATLFEDVPPFVHRRRTPAKAIFEGSRETLPPYRSPPLAIWLFGGSRGHARPEAGGVRRRTGGWVSLRSVAVPSRGVEGLEGPRWVQWLRRRRKRWLRRRRKRNVLLTARPRPRECPVVCSAPLQLKASARVFRPGCESVAGARARWLDIRWSCLEGLSGGVLHESDTAGFRLAVG